MPCIKHFSPQQNHDNFSATKWQSNEQAPRKYTNTEMLTISWIKVSLKLYVWTKIFYKSVQCNQSHWKLEYRWSNRPEIWLLLMQAQCSSQLWIVGWRFICCLCCSVDLIVFSLFCSWNYADCYWTSAFDASSKFSTSSATTIDHHLIEDSTWGLSVYLKQNIASVLYIRQHGHSVRYSKMNKELSWLASQL